MRQPLFRDLPDEIVQAILMLSSPPDRNRFRLVSKAMKDLADADSVWLPDLYLSPLEQVPIGKARELFMSQQNSNVVLRRTKFQKESVVLQDSDRVFNIEVGRGMMAAAMASSSVQILQRSSTGASQLAYEPYHTFGEKVPVYDCKMRFGADRLLCCASLNNGTVMLYDVMQKRKLLSYTHSDGTLLFASYLDEKCVYSGGFDNTLIGVDMATEKHTIKHRACSNVMSIRGGGPTLYLGLSDTVSVFDVRADTAHDVPVSGGYVWRLHLDPVRQEVLAGGFDGTIRVRAACAVGLDDGRADAARPGGRPAQDGGEPVVRRDRAGPRPAGRLRVCRHRCAARGSARRGRLC
jgi:WD40 repeat protein